MSVDLALRYRSFPTATTNVEVPAALDRQVRCCHRQLSVVELLKDRKLRKKIGSRCRETVREKFLLTRYVEQYLDLFGAVGKNLRLQE